MSSGCKRCFRVVLDPITQPPIGEICSKHSQIVVSFAPHAVSSFLITFKPASENQGRGWPLEKLQQLATRISNGGEVIEAWRFHNRKDVSVGDRVFLLQQGRGGQRLSDTAGQQASLESRATNTGECRFISVLVDPTRQILASKAELAGMDGAASMWCTKSSGILIKAGIAEALERAVIGRLAQPISDDSGANPDWTRDELILALSFYLKHRPNPPGKESLELIKLSETLNHLGEKLFSAAERSRT